MPPSLLALKELHSERLQTVTLDLEDQSTIAELSAKIPSSSNIKLLINASGILGDGKTDPGPERSADNIDRSWLQKSLDVNLVGHVMVTQALLSKFKEKDISPQPSDGLRRVVNMSARVGSISDNRYGSLA
jgi:NAD(P)-dependent dehydrogenase (short-subunit alcohol dehydrogenase family)